MMSLLELEPQMAGGGMISHEEGNCLGKQKSLERPRVGPRRFVIMSLDHPLTHHTDTPLDSSFSSLALDIPSRLPL